jgi:hypothetical protein
MNKPKNRRHLDNRTLRTIALLMIVGTVPFYLIGGGLWLAAPRTATPTPRPGLQPTITREGDTIINTPITPIITENPQTPTEQNQPPTFSQFTPGTIPPTITVPPTRFMTFTPTATSAATNTFTPEPATNIPPTAPIVPTTPPLIPATDTPSF